MPDTPPPGNVNPATLEWYKQQSEMTDPGRYTYLYEALPDDIPRLTQVVQGLLLHVFHTERYGVNLSEQRKKEVRLREVEDILRRAVELADQPLVQHRDPEKRVISHCRDYAVLLCSFLRHKRIPARVRAGFATYFEELHQTHWICEYWSQEKKDWIIVDAQLDAVQAKFYEIDFDPLDVPAGKFLYAGREYKLTHSNNGDLFDVKRSLIQDLAALNKIEVEIWDVTDFMDVDIRQNPEASNLLQQIAEITISPRDSLPEIRHIYENRRELQIPLKRDN
ncbi:MAG: transglutaminase domain-containing protein [Sedimentisphaerales bacterium]|nr:transglutaminase domain-containing protein [Sedimentisphaerales bacterium]